MSEFRFDPVRKTWVVLAAQRGQRPSQYQSEMQAFPEPRNCPFCPGNETMTPPEVYSRRPDGSASDTPGWTIRVVPNKFPVLTTEIPAEDFRLFPNTGGIHTRIPGFGCHEIIIETSIKNKQMVDMDSEEIAQVLEVICERVRSHIADNRFKTVIVFKNHGKEAGASLVHSHTQLIAMPIVPSSIDQQLRSFEEHRAKYGDCLMCRILQKEREEGSRVVAEEDGYTLIAPFAASSPFQFQIVPVDHCHDLSLLPSESLDGLAIMLGSTLKRLRTVLGEHPWNMVLYNAPANLDNERDAAAYHWFMEITPRLTSMAGFEMGSGFSINTVAPEECAEILRT